MLAGYRAGADDRGGDHDRDRDRDGDGDRDRDRDSDSYRDRDRDRDGRDAYGAGDADADVDVIRAWWSRRSLVIIRWLMEHGFDPFAPGGEVDVLRDAVTD